MIRSLTFVSTVGCIDSLTVPKTAMTASTPSAATGAIQDFPPARTAVDQDRRAGEGSPP